MISTHFYDDVTAAQLAVSCKKNRFANFFLLCFAACLDSGQMCVVSPSHLSTALVQLEIKAKEEAKEGAAE